MAPEVGHVDLGGPVVQTWSYDGQIPGPEIRVRKGDVIQALLVNQLPVETTVHWHGVAIRNNMDGVPGMTQAPVPAGREFTYRFAVAEPGTYWYRASCRRPARPGPRRAAGASWRIRPSLARLRGQVTGP